MLPDYPEIKSKIIKKFNSAIDQEILRDPFLSDIPRKCNYEGHILNTTSIDGYSNKNEYYEYTSHFQATREDIIINGPDAFFCQVPIIARDFISGQQKMIFNDLSNITEKTGKIVNGKNKPLMLTYIESLEKYPIEFELGMPIFPAVIVNPANYDKFVKMFDEMEKNAIAKALIQILIWKKWWEWRDRENDRKNNRKLVE